MTSARCSIVIPVHNKAALTRQCLDAIYEHPPDGGSRDPRGGRRLHGRDGRDAGRVRRRASGTCGSSATPGSPPPATTARPRPGRVPGLPEQRHHRPARLARRARRVRGRARRGGRRQQAALPRRHRPARRRRLQSPRAIRCTSTPASRRTIRPSTSRAAFQAVTAACMLVRRDAFEQVGGFDTGYHNDLEDVDLCLRLGQRGHEVHYCHESVAVPPGVGLARPERPAEALGARVPRALGAVRAPRRAPLLPRGRAARPVPARPDQLETTTWPPIASWS